MPGQPFRIGAVFPQKEIGTDPIEIRDFAQGVEALGYSHLVVYDHVIGADLTNRPDWNMPYHLDTMFHEPLALFAYLAGTTQSLGLTTGVIILPQRQTVLFAKQASTVDILCNGRLRLGVGIGWNKVEYDSLGVPFTKRGKVLDEQMALLRRLWTERSLSDEGTYHRIEAAGIYPLPVQRPIPLWVGGSTEPAMQRAARIGDGWLPYLLAARASEKVQEFNTAVKAANRDPADVPLENIIFFAAWRTPRRTIEAVTEDVAVWQKAGAAAVCIDTMNMGLQGSSQHLELLGEVAKRLDLVRR